MQMTSFLLAALVTVVFAGLYFSQKFLKNQKLSIEVSNWIILVASYVFIAYADYRFALVLGLLTLSTWFFSKKVHAVEWGIIAALGALGFFKYTNFFIESFSKLFGGQEVTLLHIILPLGISFFTFNAISYLIDIRRHKLEPRGLKDVALYLSFFPRLTSGPLQRAEDFFTQSDSARSVGWDSFSYGIQIFVFGLFKKLVIADRLSVFVNQVYETPLAFSSMTIFLAAVAYSFQIYFDFSGYSDMAIGIARIIGFKLPRNFNLPYLSHNVTEFWKRWHITLSSWLQEYLYIPLGGNRKGKIRTYINLILTMVLAGLWHGASWTYILWGLLHGLALAVHKVWMKITGSPAKEHSLVANVLSIGVTFIFTTFCWIFFRAESIDQALLIIKRIFSFQTGVSQPYAWLFFTIAVFAASTLYAFLKPRNTLAVARKKNLSSIEGQYPILDLTKFWNLVLFFVLCGLILGLAYTGGSPFIYGNY